MARADDIHCESNWLLLGTRWSCTAIVTDNNVQYRYTSDSSLLTPADTSVPMQRLAPQTMSHSQFTQADIGVPKPATAIGARWEAVDQPYEHRFAKALFVLLLVGGIALLIKPTYDLARIRNLENPDLPARFLPVR